MLPRWIQYLATPCPRSLRAMGYLREMVDIQSCRERRWWSWEPHLLRTQGVIREAADRCPSRRKAVVLGSGMLSDVPLTDLAAAFREVILVDILHPLGVRRSIRRFGNVRTLTADVTGTVEDVYRLARVPGTDLPRVTPSLFCDDPEVDLVASVNILSQLPDLPVTFLSRAGVHPGREVAAYAGDVVRAHLDYLRRLPGTVALIADFEQVTVDRAGQVVERSSTVFGVDLPWKGEEWIWHLVPLTYRGPDRGYHLRVLGIPDIKQAAAR